MKRFKTLLILAVIGMATALAQTPLVGVSFKKATGSGIDAANSIVNLTGTDKANHTFGACPNIDTGSTADYCCYSHSGTYVLHVNNTQSGFFWVKYNADDALGTAFANGGTWEILFRLSAIPANNYDAESTGSEARMAKIFSSQEGGGWDLLHDPSYGLSFQYNGTTNTLKPGKANATINTHNYYHVVVTVDKSNNTMSMYINGTKVGSKTEASISETAYVHPNIGTTKRTTDMWFCLGCDAGSQETPGDPSVNNSCRASFVFANYYSEVLTDGQISTLANTDKVQAFTNPVTPYTSDLMWDVLPGKGNTVTDQSPYHTIGTKGTLTTGYNSTYKRYEVVNSTPSNTNFAYRDYFKDHSIFQRLATHMAVEVFCKANSATPASTISPLSFQQDGGAGFEFRSAGEIKFNYNNYGYKTSTSKGGSAPLHLSTDASALDTDYHHYIYTADDVTGKSWLYKDGVLVKEYTVTADDMSYQFHKFPHAAYQWFCFNGDTKANRNSKCDYPFDGNIVFGRVWGKTLSAADAAALNTQAKATSLNVSVGASKVTTAVFPFAAVVPAGVKAYVVDAISSGEANTTLYASPGEIIPYGTPVLLYGAEGNYTFNAANLDESPVILSAPGTNLLTGSYASKVAEENQISVLRADGTGFDTADKNDEVSPLKAWLPAGNVVLRGDIPVVKFDESYDISGLSSHTGENVDFTFTRSFSEGVASTVCLPFAITGMTSGTLYAFTSIEEEAGEYVVRMTSVASTPTTANTPYLFMPSATGDVTFTGTTTVPASVTPGSTSNGNWTFAGTYEYKTWDELPAGCTALYGFAANTQNTVSPGDFVKVKLSGNAFSPAFRAVMKYNSGASARSYKNGTPALPDKLKVVLDNGNGTLNAIGTMKLIQEGEKWYTVDGTELKAQPTKRGIYIRNGKKVFVK